jgi:hypothetical protein
MDERDRALLTGSLRELLATPGVHVRTALGELGWDEVLADDPAGATTLLFTEHGRALASSNVLDDVVLAALDIPATAGYEPARAVLYPPIGSSVVATEGILITDPTLVDEVVVPMHDGPAVVSAAGLSVREAAGFDPDTHWRIARLTDGEPDPSLGPSRWRAAVAAGRRALAAELNGITSTILEIAVEHTSGRVQYGRPIASYQSVRHRLAEGHATLEASRSLLEGAWSKADDGGSAWAASAAKAQAGHAYLDVSRHAMQLCGAIGLTYEHRLHLFVQRGAVLDGLLGSASELTHDMGARLLDGYRPPTVVDL